MTSLTQSKKSTVAFFLLPSLVGFSVFILAPMFMAIILAFTNYSGGPAYEFIGMKNFVMAFTKGKFLSYLWITFRYMVITVIFEISLGMAFALLLSQNFKGAGIFRSIFYIPNILCSIAIGLGFLFFFEPTSGIFNHVLSTLGLPTSKWLTGTESALNSIIIVAVWQSFGYYMVLFVGGLQNINPSLYEAATVDGANWWQRFLKITLPGLSPIMFFATIMAIINGFKVFDYIFVMTGGQDGGGPAGATNVLAFDIYRNAFTYFRLGYASAESVMLILIVLTITVIQQIGQKNWVVYDAV
jgi:ABC-type sugar transport system permease subunit